MARVLDTNLKMAEPKDQTLIHFLLLHGMKQAGTLIMIPVVAMVTSMLLKDLIQQPGLVQGQHLIPVMMSLPVIQMMVVTVTILMQDMIVMAIV